VGRDRQMLPQQAIFRDQVGAAADGCAEQLNEQD
jgi:hypothetical protein